MRSTFAPLSATPASAPATPTTSVLYPVSLPLRFTTVLTAPISLAVPSISSRSGIMVCLCGIVTAASCMGSVRIAATNPAMSGLPNASMTASIFSASYTALWSVGLKLCSTGLPMMAVSTVLGEMFIHALFFPREMLLKERQRLNVAGFFFSRYLPDACGSRHRDFSPRFPRVDVREVYFHGRQTRVDERVVERVAVVGECSEVDNDARRIAAFCLQEVYERPLMIRLERLHGVPKLFGFSRNEPLDLGERRAAVVFGVALAEAIEVGAVNEEYRCHIQSVASGNYSLC